MRSFGLCRRPRPVLARALIVAAMLQASAASAADIAVMSGGAPKEALAILIPRFEKLTGHHVRMTYQLITALRRKVAEGETPDMVLSPLPVITDLEKSGKLAGGALPLGTIRLVVIVRQGAPVPDIATPGALRETLLKARSIVYSTPNATPSGTHMARITVELGIADAIGSKVTYRPALDGGAEMVARGEAEIGIYPSSEVTQVQGVAQAGPLPDPLQLVITYGGAVSTANPAPEPALSFVRFLAEAENTEVWRHAGFTKP